MTDIWRSTLDPVFYPAVNEVQAEASGVGWSAIWAGAVTAAWGLCTQAASSNASAAGAQRVPAAERGAWRAWADGAGD